jgi:hypothetical protein
LSRKVQIVIACVLATLAVLSVTQKRHAPRSSKVPKRFSHEIAQTPNSASQTVSTAVSNPTSVPISRVAEIRTYEKAKAVDPYFDWKHPIEFYGKVVNQDGTGLPEVSIRLQWTDLSARGSTETNLQTDSDGRFSLKGVKGKALVVFPFKSGFSRQRIDDFGFEFADPSVRSFYKPHSNNPAIFHLFEHGAPEPLIHDKSVSKLVHDGSEHKIGLSGGNGLSLGIFIVKSWAEKRSATRPKPSWRTELRMENADLIVASDTLLFAAPKEGYTETLKWDFVAGSATWQAEIDQDLYFRTRSPVLFGKIHVSYLSWSDAISLEYWINPKGSRSLDPSSKE